MGTAHSTINEERGGFQGRNSEFRHKTRLESTLDMMYCACPCETDFDPDDEYEQQLNYYANRNTNARTRSRRRQMNANDDDLDDGLMKHFFPPSLTTSSSPSPFTSRSFNLNNLHPSQGPHLGASEWIPLAIPEGVQSIDYGNDSGYGELDGLEELDISNICSVGQGEVPESADDSPFTPPRFKNGSASRDYDHRILSTPSFLMQHAYSFSTPRLRRNPSHGSSRSHLSSSTFRTATTTSEDSRGSVTGSGDNYSGKMDKRRRERSNEVTITFTPRRLFGNDSSSMDDSYSDHWNHSHNYDHDHDQGTTTTASRSNAKNTISSATTKSSCLLGTDYLESVPSRDQQQRTLRPRPSPSSFFQDHPSMTTSTTSTGTGSPQEHDLTMTTTTSNYTYGNSILDDSSGPRSPRTSCDQSSIIVRNGLLQREITPASPTLSTYKGVNANIGSTREVPDGIEKNGLRHINTLPSFRQGEPIRLKVKESYAGFSTVATVTGAGSTSDEPTDTEGEEDGNGTSTTSTMMNMSNISLLSDAEQANFFSYDPYFSLGQYLISTMDDKEYGNGLVVNMGERYMTLEDSNGRVSGIMRSRHTFVPSAVIYSPKPRYPGQAPSSHRPRDNNGRLNLHHARHHSNLPHNDNNSNDDGVELYPWALVKKHGRRMDHDVSIHMVAETYTTSNDLVGGLFEKEPTFRSRHGFDDQDGHSHTIVYRVDSNGNSTNHEEIPCCLLIRDPINRDLFEITIAPGIDPLMIICYMAVHSKMDVEPKLSDM